MSTSMPFCTIALWDVSVVDRREFVLPEKRTNIPLSPDGSYLLPWDGSEFVLTPDAKNARFDVSISAKTPHANGLRALKADVSLARYYVGLPLSVALADVDGDGRDDVIVSGQEYVAVVHSRPDAYVHDAVCKPRDQEAQNKELGSIARKNGVDIEDRVEALCRMRYSKGTEGEMKAIAGPLVRDSSVGADTRLRAAICAGAAPGLVAPIANDRTLDAQARVGASLYLNGTQEGDDAHLLLVHDGGAIPPKARLQSADWISKEEVRAAAYRFLAVEGSTYGLLLHHRILAYRSLNHEMKMQEEAFASISGDVMADKAFKAFLRGLLGNGRPNEKELENAILLFSAEKSGDVQDKIEALYYLSIGEEAVGMRLRKRALFLAEQIPSFPQRRLAELKCWAGDKKGCEEKAAFERNDDI